MIPLLGYPQSIPDHNTKGMSFYQEGEMLNILDFQEYHLLDIKKIALALARSTRYCGNSPCRTGQHCVRGAEAFLLMGEPQLALDFLLHEVSEAIGISDVPKPFKLLINDILKPIEHDLEKKIVTHFGGNFPFDPRIKMMDNSLAVDEITMMKHTEIPYDFWDEDRTLNNFVNMYEKLKLYITNYNKI